MAGDSYAACVHRQTRRIGIGTRDSSENWPILEFFFFHEMNVIVKFVVGITQPHHLLCIQIIILTIQAKNINNKASGHENENYQKNTRASIDWCWLMWTVCNNDNYSPILCLGAKQRIPSPSSADFYDSPGKVWAVCIFFVPIEYPATISPQDPILNS